MNSYLRSLIAPASSPIPPRHSMGFGAPPVPSSFAAGAPSVIPVSGLAPDMGARAQRGILTPGDLFLIKVGDLDDRMRVIAYVIWLSAVSQFTQEWAADATKGVSPKDDEGTIRAVFDALKSSVRYEFHPRGTDRFQLLSATIRMGEGDCDASTIALCSVLHDKGFATGARIVSGDGKVWEHIYALVGFPRNNPRFWIPLDLTVGPDGTPASATPNWEIPLERMATHRDYRWDIEL